jgi:hypothetical protein
VTPRFVLISFQQADHIIYDINETKGKIWVYVRVPPLSLLSFIAKPKRIDCFALVQLFMKTVKVEAFFNFTFGTGKNKNLVCDLTEFVDSKVFAGDNSGDSTEGNSNA